MSDKPAPTSTTKLENGVLIHRYDNLGQCKFVIDFEDKRLVYAVMWPDGLVLSAFWSIYDRHMTTREARALAVGIIVVADMVQREGAK